MIAAPYPYSTQHNNQYLIQRENRVVHDGEDVIRSGVLHTEKQGESLALQRGEEVKGRGGDPGRSRV